jgi:rod shape determining protein RodA
MAQYVDTVRATRRRRPLRLARVEGAPLLVRLDWVLLAATAALLAYGLWAISGITRHDVPDNASYFLTRQLIFACVGVVLMVGAVLVDPQWYRRSKTLLYTVMVGMIALVYAVGTVARGSRRWIDVSFFRFQPSEFAKLLFVLFIAAFLADRLRRIEDISTPLVAIALALPPVLLVFLQPDLGSGLVYFAALGACLFVAGIRWLHLAILGGIVVLAATAALWILPAAGIEVLKPYQAARLTGFTNPNDDPRGTNYNQRQSITAVGSGGFSGRGVDEATQTRLDYLPEHATDFAFASLSEQRGFVGAAVLLLLYLLVVWRALKIVTIASDAFSAIVAAGIAFALLFQIFVNVGMTIGVAPVTGITLPFVSVGGSSLVANLVAIGVLEAIHVRGRRRS